MSGVRLYITVSESQMNEINRIASAIHGDAWGGRVAILRKMVFVGLRVYEEEFKKIGHHTVIPTDTMHELMRAQLRKEELHSESKELDTTRGAGVG